MQPSSPDPTNSTGQLSSSSPSEKLSMAQSPDAPGSTDQPYPLSPYPQTESPVAPPPPLESYPPGEEAYYRQLSQGGPITQHRAQLQEKISEPAKPKRNGWKIIATILAVLVLILATTTTTLLLTRPPAQQIVQATPVPATVSATTQPVLQTTPTATQGVTGATATPVLSQGSYNAPTPGPGCDQNGGTWAPYPAGAIKNIECGTTLSVGADQTRGYLGLQLPGNTSFSATNRIEVVGIQVANYYVAGPTCVGLAEQDANGGYLGEYCSDGKWYIYSISSSGSIVKTLASSVTSTRQQETLMLSLQGPTLTFAVDTEVHSITVAPIQPVKVAISVYGSNNGEPVKFNNFSYVTQF